MAPAPPLPPSPRRAPRPGPGNGAGAGSDSAINEQEIRALCVPYRRVNRGLSRLITVSRNRCSTPLACVCHVVPKLIINTRASGGPPLRDDLRTAEESCGSPSQRASHRVSTGGVAGLGLGVQLVQRVGCSSWTPNPRPASKRARRRDGMPALRPARPAAGQVPACCYREVARCDSRVTASGGSAES